MVVDYSTLETLALAKGLSVQYINADDHWFLFLVDFNYTIQTTLKVGNTADDLSIIDFTANLLPTANELLDTKQVRGSDGTVIGNVLDALKIGIQGADGTRVADVFQRNDGKNAVAVDSRTIVESTFGFDPLPDSFFRIKNTGPEGTTWDISIKGTLNDPSTPDRDIPDYFKQFTVLLIEVGDELAFRDRIITELNQDTTFKDTALLKAQNATDRAIVHITSTVFSLNGEFFERPIAGDFSVTVSVGGIVELGPDTLLSRSKPISIARDPDSPHAIGIFGISGTVSVIAKDLDDLFVQNATDDGTPTGDPDMRVNGSIIAEDFFINTSMTTDVFIEELRYYGQGNGIQYKNFLSQNNPLTVGVELTIKSNNILTTFPLIKTTADFKNKFSFGTGALGFSLDVAAGRDDFLAVFTFNNPFILKVADTFGAGNDDFIRVRIQDNLTASIAEFEMIAKGFERDP